jgi:hypothetical protein
MEAVQQQCRYGGRAAGAVAATAATQQAVSSKVAGWQVIGVRGCGRAVVAEAAWQRQRLHKGGGSSTEAVAAGQQGGGGSAAAAGWC